MYLQLCYILQCKTWYARGSGRHEKRRGRNEKKNGRKEKEMINMNMLLFKIKIKSHVLNMMVEMKGKSDLPRS